ncbi:SDR family NAD(P)-dependent oxidoreductase [Desulfitobacterium hafniense]|nr:SDR family NAD(P)-dependent oxidoreductase [Desulfitobacterium hafniense]
MSKYAVVTGNERGIGKALTVDLARQGYDVLVNWFENEQDGADVVRECQQYGVKALLHYCDVREFDQVRKMKEFALENFGPDLQVFVNNAGMSIAGKLIEQDPADYMTVVNTDLIGAMHCAHEFGPVLKDNKAGWFIIIGSCSGIRSTLGNCAYGVAKAGIMGLTRGLAQELGPYGVTVNNIAPGYINTARSAAFCGPEMIAGIKKTQVLDLIGIEEYIVTAMNYLLANPFVSGQTLMVNGGSLMF